MPDEKKTGMQWQAPEFPYREKDVSWYWLSVILAVIILGIAVWQKNFIFALFIVIAEILILVWGSHEPRIIRFELDEHGLTIGEKKFYDYKEIDGFSLGGRPNGEWQGLFIHFKKKMSPHLRIVIPTRETEGIRKSLLTFAKEKEYEPSFIDVLEEIFKF